MGKRRRRERTRVAKEQEKAHRLLGVRGVEGERERVGVKERLCGG